MKEEEPKKRDGVKERGSEVGEGEGGRRGVGE